MSSSHHIATSLVHLTTPTTLMQHTSPLAPPTYFERCCISSTHCLLLNSPLSPPSMRPKSTPLTSTCPLCPPLSVCNHMSVSSVAKCVTTGVTLAIHRTRMVACDPALHYAPPVEVTTLHHFPSPTVRGGVLSSSSKE
jgi:hypothetical protein